MLYFSISLPYTRQLLFEHNIFR